MAQGRDCGFEARRGRWVQSDLQRVTGYRPYKLMLWRNALGTAEVKSAKSAIPEDLQSVLASLTPIDKIDRSDLESYRNDPYDSHRMRRKRTVSNLSLPRVLHFNSVGPESEVLTVCSSEPMFSGFVGHQVPHCLRLRCRLRLPDWQTDVRSHQDVSTSAILRS